MVSFGQLLRQLRTGAGLTPGGTRAGGGPEHPDGQRPGTRHQPDRPQGHRPAAGRRAEAWTGPDRAAFETAARGRDAAGGVAAATRTLPRDIASFTGRAAELRPAERSGGRAAFT